MSLQLFAPSSGLAAATRLASHRTRAADATSGSIRTLIAPCAGPMLEKCLSADDRDHPDHPAALALAACLALLAGPLSALAQDAGPGQGDGPTQQSSSVQRVEIAARQGATDLRRAASVAKQIYGRDELDSFGDTNALDVLRRLPGVSVGAGGPRMRGLGAGYTDQSAQAIAGSINIILKDAPRRTQRDLRLGLTDGKQRPRANLNLTLGEAKGPLGLSLPVSLFEWRRENTSATDRQMPGIDGLPAHAQQLGHQQVWGWGYNIGPRLNWKISDEQALALQGFAQKGYWHNRTNQENHVLSGQPVLEDDTQQQGTWQNLRGNLTWTNRFRDDQRVELRAGVQQSKWTLDVVNLRQGSERLRTVGHGDEEGLSQAGKYSWLLGQSHSLTVGWDLEAKRRLEERSVTEQGVPVLADFEGQPFDAQVRRQAFYLQDEWEISPALQMYLGLRNERIRTESHGNAAPVINESSVLSPLWHLTYKLDPKGRDMVRASLTRSYKAPVLSTLLARPSVNSQFTNTNAGNTELAPDRIGNPALAPELATGLDIAFEKYLPAGGLWSVGVFHRQIASLVRTVTTLQPVAWASVPRWVAQPLNFSSATTSG
ncbi:MAG: TonB-dependent receptor, partial [Betaproteobacteria bacterium]|nr:TonB-dependent receptor [Betaproteobacteria bacterium]